MNGSCLGPPDDIQRNRLMRVAAETANLKVEVSCIECIRHRRRWLRRALIAEHALIPCFAGESISKLTRFSGALRRGADRTAVYGLAGFGGHGRIEAQPKRLGNRPTAWCSEQIHTTAGGVTCGSTEPVISGESGTNGTTG
jgi:hypothetical protein